MPKKLNPDNLTGMAILLEDLRHLQDQNALEARAARTNLLPQRVETLFETAGVITEAFNAPGVNQGVNSSLERDPRRPDLFGLTGRRAVAIIVEDPNNHGEGFRIHINDAGDGPVIDVYPLNSSDPADEPHFTAGFAYNDYLSDEDDS